jgi:peptidoglycan/xylan/chitin deacetylase (PgdA/CDA1 family)
MMKRFAGIILIIMPVLIIFTGCKKFEKTGAVQQPGVVLTFDDDNVRSWVEYLPLLDSAGVRATFYICRYNRFTDEQKRMLATIQSHGHEIAFHGTNHYNMMDYVYKQKHTIDDMMKCEITDGLKLMNRDGFYPTTFAYPMGAHNGLFDKMLKRYFKSVRALNGTNDFSKSLVPTEHNEVLYGLGIDKSSKRSDQEVLQVIKSAYENKDCAVFVAHAINLSRPLSVTTERLSKMFALIKSLGLKYYTVSEISN